MRTIIYYSRNAKNNPHKVTVNIKNDLVYIDCDCSLGADKQICRHKINAIRGDKRKSHESTSDEVIEQLRFLFGIKSSLRKRLEEDWEALRVFSSENKDKTKEIEAKRKALGLLFSEGFLNERIEYLNNDECIGIEIKFPLN